MAAKKSILFVDDEPNILSGIRRMLRGMRSEWDMNFSTSGKEALEYLVRNHVDVIVSDMRMPEMDGATLLQNVSEKYPHVVRIVLSGQADKEEISRSIRTVFNATDRLTELTGRPFSPDGHLVGSLGEVLAAIELGLQLAPPSTEGYDAVDADGKFVEIKATTRNAVALSASGTKAERLVVVRIDSVGNPTIVYDGPSAPAWKAAGKPQKNGQRRISLSRLTGLDRLTQ